MTPVHGYVPAGRARLFFRDIGTGRPIVVLHGGPDFDHSYLLPELEAVRRHFGLDTVALLGHSWGGVLAMEYAIRHQERVSHLILLNTAPASRDDAVALGQHLRRIRPAGDVERMQAISDTAECQRGDIDVEAEYYRIHFKPTVRTTDRLVEIVGRLRANVTEEGVLTSRAIEQRLYDETWSSEGYDLEPRLRELTVRTLVIHGEDDFIPVDVAARIAEAVPGAQFHVLPGCGHFAYLEAPDLVHRHIATFLTGG